MLIYVNKVMSHLVIIHVEVMKKIEHYQKEKCAYTKIIKKTFKNSVMAAMKKALEQISQNTT